MERVGVVLVEPRVAVEEEELLAPEHAGKRLTHHARGVFAHRRGRDRLIELIGLAKAVNENLIEGLAKRLALPLQVTAGQPQANHTRLASPDRDVIVRSDLGAVLVRIHCVLSTVHHTLVDAVFDIGALVLSPEQPGVVGFVFGEQQRHVAFA